MKPSLATALLLLLGTLLAGPLRGEAIYLAPRQDGLPGSGKKGDPYDVSTQPKFDALLRKFYLAQKPVEFHFAPGTYLTLGEWGNYGGDNWAALSGWKFYGAGMDRTILKLAAYRYLKPADKFPDSGYVISQAPWGRSGIEVKDLTVDCNWTGFATCTTAPFPLPAAGAALQIAVADAAKLSPVVGKYIYLQNPDRSGVGIYTLLSIDGPGTITACNDGAADPRARNGYDEIKFQGTVVPPGCLVAPELDTTGISIGSIGSIVERVHVTNTGAPVSEECLGICIVAIGGERPVKPGSGNIVRDCLVDNLWGQEGWGITMVSNNPDTGDDGTRIEGWVEGNTVLSTGGTHQGLSGWGTGRIVWRHNVVRDCRVGWFEDSGYDREQIIEDNLFENNRTGIQIGSGSYWKNGVIRGNTLVVPPGRTGILCNGKVGDSVNANNRIVSSGPGVGLNANPAEGHGNTVSGNQISPSLSVLVPPEFIRAPMAAAQ